MNTVITEQSNVNLSEGNVQVFGKGNVIPSGLKGIVIGDNQSVTEDGITTTNLTVTETINGQSVTEILPTYTKYIALISQTGILDPTVIILENTIGDIIFSRIGAGYYEATLTGAFLINKTWVVGGSADNTAGSGDFATLDIRRISDNVISLRTYDNFSPFDDMLVNTSIEIRVYP
jgi:hypothetical protein